jgi:ATP-dependent protease HslVU (ClpYQ) ATPase subunit
MEDISFNASKYSGQRFLIDRTYVAEKLKHESKSIDLTKFLI